MSKEYFVYIMTNKKEGVFYIGVTNNLAMRVWQHKNDIGSEFVEKYNIKTLVYAEPFANINEALVFEKKLKRWKREWKIELIEKQNPNWNDLYNQSI